MTDAEEHRALITHWLARLGGAAGPLRSYTLLQAGLSGSHVYRLETAEVPLVLKVTPAGAVEYIAERARREVAFYRTLAAAVPLALPTVRAAWAGDDTTGSALLLVAYAPVAPAPVWREAGYLEVAAQLARFHAAFWDRAADMAAYPWLRRPEPAALPRRVAGARGSWQALQAQPRLAAVLPGEVLARIGELLDRVPALDAARQALPPTLCHGDCHLDNLLRDADGRLLWSDWQEVGLGPGPEDLAFLMQRAAAAGGAVPEAALVARYSEDLARHTGRPISPQAIRRVLAAAELYTRLLFWPAYLGEAPADDVAAQVGRITALAAGLPL